MVAQIRLIVTSGELTGEQFLLPGRTLCVVGRALGCALRLSPYDLLASRHHCLLDVDGPRIAVMDLHSSNGTFVNGQRIGQHGRLIDDLLCAKQPLCCLSDGDELQVGETVFRVAVSAAAASSDEPPEQTEARNHEESGMAACSGG